MGRNRTFIVSLAGALAAAVLVWFPAGPAGADDDTEAKLRGALRGAIVQQRALEDQRAALQAQVAGAESRIAALEAEVAARPDPEEVARKEADYKERIADRDEALKALDKKVETLIANIEALSGTLEKWKAAYNEAAGVARAKEAARAKLAAEKEELTVRVNSCEANNVELFKVGSEILERYAAVGFGDVLKTREPFLGFKKVELQNLVQDYRDKLLDQQVRR